MEIPVPDAETALQLYQSALYCLAYVLTGAALIAVATYIVLLSSEMLAARVRSKGSSHRVQGAAVAETNSTLAEGELSALGGATGVDEPILEVPAPRPPAANAA